MIEEPLIAVGFYWSLQRSVDDYRNDKCLSFQAYCVTEPVAGSDVAGIKTKAEKKGDHVRIFSAYTCTRYAYCMPSRMKARSVGQIAVGQARFEAYDVKKITLFLGFCCVDFITSKKQTYKWK